MLYGCALLSDLTLNIHILSVFLFDIDLFLDEDNYVQYKNCEERVLHELRTYKKIQNPNTLKKWLDAEKVAYVV